MFSADELDEELVYLVGAGTPVGSKSLYGRLTRWVFGSSLHEGKLSGTVRGRAGVVEPVHRDHAGVAGGRKGVNSAEAC